MPMPLRGERPEWSLGEHLDLFLKILACWRQLRPPQGGVDVLDAGDDSPDPLLVRKLQDRRNSLPGAVDLTESDPCHGEVATASCSVTERPFRSAGVLVGGHGPRGVVLGL